MVLLRRLLSKTPFITQQKVPTMAFKTTIEHFPHPFYDGFSAEANVCFPRVIDDLIVQKLSDTIRSKPDWTTKYKNEDIKKKWIAEMEGQLKLEPDLLPLHPAEAIWKFVFEELAWYEKYAEETGFTAGPNENVLFSDSALDDDFRKSLKKSVYEKLEDVPEDSKDWHPGSDNQVLDLVHPSLYPLQYGKTLVVTEKGYEVSKMIVTKEIPKYTHYYGKDFLSENYQWLPSIFHVSKENGEYDVNIQSYINNLDPVKYGSLYPLISSVFAKAIPGLNLLLTHLSNLERLRVDYPRFDYMQYRLVYDKEFNSKLEALEGSDDYNWEEYERIFEGREGHIDKSKFPLDFKTPVFEKKVDLADFGDLKVITKLANIHLTPEKPSYPGGSWHVEGTVNEDIVATVLYYYDSENIGESKLSFRNATVEPKYEQGDDITVKRIFGLNDEDRLTRYLGSVDCIENRLLIFPNVYQHHVEPFELVDKTKPGHRKILCFFLVDPNNKHTFATDKVPPQQQNLLGDKITSFLGKETSSKLPTEILDLIANKVQYTISLDEAKKVREKLMEERTPEEEDEYGGSNVYTSLFSLCEH
ncbi:BA75_02687T0 [Komagataella pastoris]|uniref:BA75_02687T0 n=1 Tax=Komagataella pastoris TaxID=4922 RepID=A0A1B2JAS2_PICPA|nr:BA75_02687T0 [Komagataella pastoris]